MGRPRRSAHSFTGEAASCCPRPRGRSGCVSTASTWWPVPTIRSSVGTANAGVPRKTSFIGVSGPLPGFLQFLDLALDQVALQRAEMRNVEPAVEVIGLGQQGARQQILAGDFVLFALRVLRPRRDFPAAAHLLANFGNAEAALFAFLLA